MEQVIVNSKAERRIREGHPWIFHDDILEEPQNISGACLIINQQKKILASALYSASSKIRLRIYAWKEQSFDQEFIINKLSNAALLRNSINSHETCYRLFFGESDGIPSLIIDRYQDLYTFQTLSAGLEVYKPIIVQSIIELFSPTSIVERNDAKVRQKENLPLMQQYVYGPAPETKIISIFNHNFEIRPLSGQKTGFFLDQRLHAQYLSTLAQGNSLDACCYEGQFSIPLARNSRHVLALDISASSLTQVLRNAELNKINNIEIMEANIFDALKNFDREGREFDTIVLDPPAFVKSRQEMQGASRGYHELNLRALKLLHTGGLLATFSCSQLFTDDLFLKMLMHAAQDAKRQVQMIHQFEQPYDHPILLSTPETKYFKGYLLRVI